MDHPALLKSDTALLSEIFSILNSRIEANAYNRDGSYAADIGKLPTGLRAMAATHYLDVSLALDDIGWHFLNFGEANFVRETEAGLRILGLHDLAEWFHEAHSIVKLFLDAVQSGVLEGRNDVYLRWLKETGNEERIDALSQFAWDKNKVSANGSAIYAAWIRYARGNPDEIFSMVM